MKRMTIGTALDQVQYQLGMMKDSTAWKTQRPVVRVYMDKSIKLLEHEFYNRLRYVPNVLLKPAKRGNYDEPESISTYHVPDDCDPQLIESLSVNWAGLWTPLPQGISQRMRDFSYASTPTYLAWDVIECGEIEVWPHPDEFHKVRICYYRLPTDYLNDEESACVDIDEQLLIMLTLDETMPFYGRPQEQTAANNRHLNRHLGNIKAKNLQNKRFFKGKDEYPAGTPDAADQIYTIPYRPRTTT